MVKNKMGDKLSARPEFTCLSEAEVWNAINGNDCAENPITAEVTRLVANYTARFMVCARQYENVPPQIMFVRARWPIERVAVLLLVGLVGAKGEFAAGVTRH
jgi:hypothetical protein